MSTKKKSEVEILKEKLMSSPKNAAALADEAEIKKADKFCEGYMKFLSQCKTEREAAAFVVEQAKKAGFTEFDAAKKYKSGDKVYFINRLKSVILCVFGKKSAANGVKIAAAHIDSPRVDLKPYPLYEDSDLALFKTHYYGGIKKYQWTCVPLSLHGVVIRKDGTSVTVKLGEDKNEPAFVITDLLPHLDKQNSSRTVDNVIKGEELNILVGSRPFRSDEGSELVKLNIMNLINQKYGITEEDFLSAELELVPAYEPRDIGFDRSLIGAYGHDDRVCAYPSVMAALDVKNPEYTTVTVVTDKEETGSDGATGLNSQYLEQFICDIARIEGLEGRDVIRKSECLSADVGAAFDPTFPSVADKMNFAAVNRGVIVMKYTGARGKAGTNDANAEFIGKIRGIFDKAGVYWQMGELGKVDEGGGGTVAKYIANMGVEVVDAGVPVLSMHAPFEVVSKIDVYMMYKAVKAFYSAK